MTRHLPREQLLRYLDGELSKVTIRKTTKHLQTCSECAAEFGRLKDQLAIVVGAQGQVFRSAMPPPEPWPALQPRLHAAANANTASWWKQLLSPVRPILRARFGYASAALSLFLIALLIWGPLSPVSAKEVVKRAIAADTERLVITRQQVIRQRVRIKRTARHVASVQTARLESWKSTRSAFWRIRAVIL